ncbi:MAG: alpha/beta hydrolase [Chloroflexota bacterium]
MELAADALAAQAPVPDIGVEPDGFLVEIAPGERIHFLDWGGPSARTGRSVILVHGLGGTAWGWTAVARRLHDAVRAVAIDLRGHGLSDAPTDPYEPDTLVSDVVAVAEGAGLVERPDVADRRTVVLVGHGYGGMVAAWAAADLGERCAGLVLVDGGWQDVADETGLTPAEFLREVAEPPEVLASMEAYLADRRDWDPRHWDGDEERAARATVVAVPAGHVVPAIRPHALERSVEAIFRYRPTDVLTTLDVPIVALVAVDDEDAPKATALQAVQDARRKADRPPLEVARFPADGHNLPRYRPDELAGAILRLVAR